MSVDIKEIVSKQGIDSVKQTTIELEKSVLVLQDFIVGAKAMNDVLAKSGSMGQLTKNVQAQEIAQEKLKQSILRTQALEVKLENDRQAAFAKEQARKAKSLADEQKAIVADEKRIAVLQRKANASFQATGSGETQGSNTGTTVNSGNIDVANAANSASAINTNTQAVQGNTQAKKLNNLQQEQANQLAKVDRLNLVAQAKENNAVKGSLEQRQLALARLQKSYTLLTAEERASPFGQRLSKVIPQLNDQVLTLEKSLGKSQRDVGNYGNAFSKAGSKAFSALKTIANILPGVGLAGLVGFAVEPIIEYVKQLDIFKTKIQDTAKATAAASSEYKKAVSDVNAIKTSVAEFNEGTISKKELVDRFNESIGTTIGKLKTAQEVEDFVNSKAAAFIEATYLRAQANAALQLSTEKVTEALQRQIDGPSIGDYAKGLLNSLRSGTFSGADLIFGTAKARDEGIKGLQKSGKELATLYDQLQKKADKYAKDNGFSFRTDTKDGKKGVDPAIQARKNAAALIQVQIELAKEEADIYKSQMDNLDYSLETRLESQLKFEEQMAKISKLEADKSRAEKVNSADELKAIEAKSQKEISKVTRQGVEERFKIIKQEADQAEQLRLLAGQRVLTTIEKQRDEELIAVNLAYSNGLISLETFEKRKLEISRKYALIEVAEQIKQAEELIAVQKATGLDTTDAEAKLTAIKLKRLGLLTDATKEANEKQIQSEKEKFEKIVEIGQELFDFSRGLTAGIFEANIANLEEEGRIRDERKNTDIENVNESILSEEEKANRIAVINAQAEQAQIAIDAKIAEQKRKQAIADKAFALSQIAINTAIAVSKALAQTGVLGAFVIPGIIALGAIQVATVLAQPIPKFAKGGVMGKDGLAEYGHGVETRIDPDGRVSLTDATPEIGFVKKGTRFISASETKQMLAKPDKYDVGGKSWDIAGIVASQDRTAKRIEKSVNKLKVPSTIITKGGWSDQQSRVSKMNSYIKSNFGR